MLENTNSNMNKNENIIQTRKNNDHNPHFSNNKIIIANGKADYKYTTHPLEKTKTYFGSNYIVEVNHNNETTISQIYTSIRAKGYMHYLIYNNATTNKNLII